MGRALFFWVDEGIAAKSPNRMRQFVLVRFNNENGLANGLLPIFWRDMMALCSSLNELLRITFALEVRHAIGVEDLQCTP